MSNTYIPTHTLSGLQYDTLIYYVLGESNYVHYKTRVKRICNMTKKLSDSNLSSSSKSFIRFKIRQLESINSIIVESALQAEKM